MACMNEEIGYSRLRHPRCKTSRVLREALGAARGQVDVGEVTQAAFSADALHHPCQGAPVCWDNMANHCAAVQIRFVHVCRDERCMGQ